MDGRSPEEERLLRDIGRCDVLRGEAPYLPVVARCCARAAVQAVAAADRDAKAFRVRNMKMITLLLVTGVAVAWTLIWFQDVFIPFVLAWFLLLLLKPVLLWCLNPIKPFARCSPIARAMAEETERQRVLFLSGDPGRRTSGAPLRRLFWRIWAAAAVSFCVLVVFVTILGTISLVLLSVARFNWQKYTQSPKTRLLITRMHEIGMDTVLIHVVSGPVMRLVGMIFSGFVTLLFVHLFLAFMLAASCGSDLHKSSNSWEHRVFVSVQRYARVRTVLSLSLAALSGCILLALKVDLAFFFSLATFLLNYVPYAGHAIAILLPLPMVILDPSKTWSDLLASLLYPLTLHLLYFTFVEPRTLKRALDLSPTVMLGALGFWTLCWGLLGALLAIPLTSVIRLTLEEIQHPYAEVMVGLLRGESFGRPQKTER